MLFLTRVFLGDSVTFFSFFPTFATTSKIEDATTAAFNPVRKGVPCRECWDELRGEEDKETAGRFPSGVTNPSASRFSGWYHSPYPISLLHQSNLLRQSVVVNAVQEGFDFDSKEERAVATAHHPPPDYLPRFHLESNENWSHSPF